MRQRRALQPSLLVACLQIFHFARAPLGNPARKIFQFRRISDRSDANQIETRVRGGLRYRSRDFRSNWIETW